MPSRRHFLAGSAALLFAAPTLAALPAGDALAFRIMRKGSRIGTHALTFQKSPDALTVKVDVEIVVTFAYIPLFRYTHHNLECWRGGVVESMDATTDYDGTPAFAVLRRENGKMIAEGSRAARYEPPADTLPATHWNKAELAGPMLNPENGMLLRPAIADAGPGHVTTASGADIAARHFTWRGAETLDLWYEPDGTWAALTALAKDGSLLVYERL